MSKENDDDPELFPGRCVARLSDYASIMERMESGDVAGAFSEYDLDFKTWGAAVHAWGKELARDPQLSEKLARWLKRMQHGDAAVRMAASAEPGQPPRNSR
jgi:hypothetical protein